MQPQHDDSAAIAGAVRFLYAGAAAHLRGNDADLTLLVHAVLAESGVLAVAESAALSVAELLRDVADLRQMSPSRMLDMFEDRAPELTQHDPVQSVILAGSAAYLDNAPRLWASRDVPALLTRPMSTATSCVRVHAAALSWRAAQFGEDALEVSERVCLRMAGRQAANV